MENVNNPKRVNYKQECMQWLGLGKLPFFQVVLLTVSSNAF